LRNYGRPGAARSVAEPGRRNQCAGGRRVVESVRWRVLARAQRARRQRHSSGLSRRLLGQLWPSSAWRVHGLERLEWPEEDGHRSGIYLDRPLYQYQDESLRWFDYWLKGIDTGVMDEPPIRCFIPPTGEWKILNDWPPPEARWTTFYLHKDEILSEHELWPGEGVDSFDE